MQEAYQKFGPDLMELKYQIESTKSEEGLYVGEREFAWIYEPNCPIKRLKEIDSLNSSVNGGHKHAVHAEIPSNTNALARIHNHPSGDVSTNYTDIDGFLKFIQLNPHLRFDLIASTEGGSVTGYSIMTYFGRVSEARALCKRIEQMYQTYCDLRHREIEEHPERFNIKWGEDIFSIDEQRNMALEMLPLSKIAENLFPMPGYKSEGWKFVKS